jgi:hypothetical protein
MATKTICTCDVQKKQRATNQRAIRELKRAGQFLKPGDSIGEDTVDGLLTQCTNAAKIERHIRRNR